MVDFIGPGHLSDPERQKECGHCRKEYESGPPEHLMLLFSLFSAPPAKTAQRVHLGARHGNCRSPGRLCKGSGLGPEPRSGRLGDETTLFLHSMAFSFPFLPGHLLEENLGRVLHRGQADDLPAGHGKALIDL